MFDFVKKKVARWVKCVQFLAEAARKHSHEFPVDYALGFFFVTQFQHSEKSTLSKQ